MFWQGYFPDPVLLSLGSVTIRWYGLILVVAIATAGLLARKYLVGKQILTRNQFDDLSFWLIVSGLIGARFGHVVFFEFSYYLQNPEDIIKVWQGGLSIQGALLFGILTALWWARKNHVSFWTITDAIVPTVALGQAIGRMGNFFNQELYGKPVSWGISIGRSQRIDGYEQYSYFHPTFLYELVLNFSLFLILYKILKKQKMPKGMLTLFYFVGYSLIRFFMEFIRIDQTLVVYGIRLPQLISAVVCLIAVVLIIYFYNKKRK